MKTCFNLLLASVRCQVVTKNNACTPPNTTTKHTALQQRHRQLHRTPPPAGFFGNRSNLSRVQVCPALHARIPVPRQRHMKLDVSAAVAKRAVAEDTRHEACLLMSTVIAPISQQQLCSSQQHNINRLPLQWTPLACPHLYTSLAVEHFGCCFARASSSHILLLIRGSSCLKLRSYLFQSALYHPTAQGLISVLPFLSSAPGGARQDPTPSAPSCLVIQPKGHGVHESAADSLSL